MTDQKHLGKLHGQLLIARPFAISPVGQCYLDEFPTKLRTGYAGSLSYNTARADDNCSDQTMWNKTHAVRQGLLQHTCDGNVTSKGWPTKASSSYQLSMFTCEAFAVLLVNHITRPLPPPALAREGPEVEPAKDLGFRA